MANIKVSEMSEQKDLTGVQAIGTINGAPCRYDIGSVRENVLEKTKSIIAPSSQHEFETTKAYYIGQFCTYPDSNGTLYRFVKDHSAGPWKGDDTNPDVVATDFWKEIESYSSSDYETLSACVGFYESDGSESSGVVKSGVDVTVKFDDGSFNTNTTNDDGLTVFTIKKGTHYVLSCEEKSGYSTPIVSEYTASISASSDGIHTYGGRSVSLNYRKGVPSLQTSSVTANIKVENGTGNIYGGRYATLIYPHGIYQSRSQMPVKTELITVDGSGNASVVFNDVKQGEYCTVYVPNLTGYEQNSAYEQDGDHGFFVTGSNVTTEINVKYSSNYGIFFVCGETPESIADGSAWREYKFEQYPGYVSGLTGEYDETTHPCVAVHINTPELAAIGAGYYVKPRSLTNQRNELVASKQWCTDNKLHPHVTTGFNNMTPMDGNGKLMTSYMMYDSNRLYGLTSPAADWAVSQNLVLNGKTIRGFVGTRVQWQPLLDAAVPPIGEDTSLMDRALKWLGFAGQNYYRGTSFWSATQYSATYAWGWVSSSYWVNYSKTHSNVVLPFFAI